MSVLGLFNMIPLLPSTSCSRIIMTERLYFSSCQKGCAINTDPTSTFGFFFVLIYTRENILIFFLSFILLKRKKSFHIIRAKKRFKKLRCGENNSYQFQEGIFKMNKFIF